MPRFNRTQITAVSLAFFGVIALSACSSSKAATPSSTTADAAATTTEAPTTTTTTLPHIEDSVKGRRLQIAGYEDRPTILQRSTNDAGPLIVLFHGMNGCIEKFQKQTDIELIGTKYGVNLLWLSGKPLPTRSWNTNGRCCEPASTNHLDDFAYVQAAINKVKSLGLTPSKYLAVGKSNGAGMAVAVGCHFPEIFSVVVSVAGWASTSCVRANLSLVAMGGTADIKLGAVPAAGIANTW